MVCAIPALLAVPSALTPREPQICLIVSGRRAPHKRTDDVALIVSKAINAATRTVKIFLKLVMLIPNLDKSCDP